MHNPDFATTGPLDKLARAGIYGSLVLIFIWFGLMKFTLYEAEVIQGLMANSPFMAFVPDLLGVRGASALIGTTELIIAALLAARIISPRISLLGGFAGAGTFVVTLSFAFTTPGVFLEGYGWPAISVGLGQFLLKDLGLLFACVWVMSESKAATEY